MVASLDLCLDWIWRCCALHCPECSPWSDVPHHISGGRADKLRTVRQPLAGLQSWCHGMVNLRFTIPCQQIVPNYDTVSGTASRRVSGASACWWPCARYGLRRTIYVSWSILRQDPSLLGLSMGFLIANTLPKRTTCPNRRERRRATSCASSSSGSSACRRSGSLFTRCEFRSLTPLPD